MRTVGATVFVLLLLLTTGVCNGWVGIVYHRRMDSQTLVSPVTITKIDGDLITFEDRRAVEVFGPNEGDEDWALVLSKKPWQVGSGLPRIVEFIDGQTSLVPAPSGSPSRTG